VPGDSQRFDVYGRFRIEVVRDGDRWVVYRLGLGTRRHDDAIGVPDSVTPSELRGVLEDLLHEYARPGYELRPISPA
jgi:hypothetical protein